MSDKIERTAVSIPLPCYGSKLDLTTDKCQRCAHVRDCSVYSGSRSGYIPISKAVFRLIPVRYNALDPFPGTDPEAAHMNSVYSLCYRTIFGKHERADLRKWHTSIEAAARRNECSIRLYMLAVMLAYKNHIAHANEISEDRLRSPHFTPDKLVNRRYEVMAVAMMNVCRAQFGTFNLGSVDLLANSERISKREIVTRMIRSETIAGTVIVGHKAAGKGPAEPTLFANHELELDEHWLAIEDSYTKLVLVPVPGSPPMPDSKVLRQKRFAVKQLKAQLARSTTAGLAVHFARNEAMPAALENVLRTYRLEGDSLEIPPEPVTNSFEFWKTIGRALQHLNALKVLYGSTLARL